MTNIPNTPNPDSLSGTNSSSLTPILQAKNLHKRYTLGQRTVQALRGVTIEILPGSLCAVVGPSGSGKSTLLNILGLLDTPDQGSLTLQGNSLGFLTPGQAAETRRTSMGFIFQDFNLLPVLSAYENVELPLRSQPGIFRPKVHKEWITALLDWVGLADHLTHRPGQLSGGQQQRVAIARALVNKPAIIFADEPTANLDTKTGQSILELLVRFNQDLGTTFVFSTHDAAVTNLATQVVHIRDGEQVLS